jgi:hypothetical protein
LADELLGDLGLALQEGQPSGPSIRATGSPLEPTTHHGDHLAVGSP